LKLKAILHDIEKNKEEVVEDNSTTETPASEEQVADEETLAVEEQVTDEETPASEEQVTDENTSDEETPAE
jgi:hypothetical protein